MILQNSRKKIILCICAIALILPYIIILALYMNKIHAIHTNDFIETDLLVCNIYEIELDNTDFYIEGGIAQVGVAENYTRENKYLYFKNNKTGEMFVTRIGEIIIGDKLTNYINDGNDYSIGGFAARIDLKCLDIYNNSYRIYCGEQNLGINMIIDTHIDLDYGKVIWTNAHIKS